MSSRFTASRPRRPSPPSLRLVPNDAAPDVVRHLTRGPASRPSAGPAAPRERLAAAWSAQGEAVRAYVARCKANGMPAERVLLRVTEAARRYRLAHRDAGDSPAIRGVAFRAFLVACYGDDRTSRPPPAPGP